MKKIEIIKELEKLIEEVEFIIRDSMKQLEVLQECLKNISTLEYPETFESANDLKKWLDENQIEYEWCHVYINGDWEYQDEQHFWHLYRDGMELTKDLKANYTWSYANGDWGYEDEQGFYHLFRNGEELTKDIKTVWVDSFENGDWMYKDLNGFDHLFRNGVELTKGIKTKWAFSDNNGDWSYHDQAGKWHDFDKDNNPI